MSNPIEIEGKFDIKAAIKRATQLRVNGNSAIPIIKQIRSEFGMGLRDAKLIYHYSLPRAEQEAQEKFWDEVWDALEKM